MQELAQAKINLTLHIGAPISEPSHRFYGYHPLSSLVVFADVGDVLRAEPADKTDLRISGPFAQGLETDETNLILKAYRAVRARADLPDFSFHLEKNLPIASGIGGGSANAAAVLRLMYPQTDLAAGVWDDIALSLGADVPVCFGSQTAIMEGIGEHLRPVGRLGRLFGILVNPKVSVSTKEIFKRYKDYNPRAVPSDQACGDPASGQALWDMTLGGRNDLQAPAIDQAPIIGHVIETIKQTHGCALARMSGSGATCFGLYQRKEDAKAAVKFIQENYPQWWCVLTGFGDKS